MFSVDAKWLLAEFFMPFWVRTSIHHRCHTLCSVWLSSCNLSIRKWENNYGTDNISWPVLEVTDVFQPHMERVPDNNKVNNSYEVITRCDLWFVPLWKPRVLWERLLRLIIYVINCYYQWNEQLCFGSTGNWFVVAFCRCRTQSLDISSVFWS